MTSTPTIAVAHYPEGAGHATRMLAVANALRESGADIEMAGGGSGTEFVSLHGYDEFEPVTVNYIDTYQGASIGRVLSESVPATAARVTEYVQWLRELDPDALVTDDMFAAIASTRTRIPLYVLKHDMPAMYEDRLERIGATFHTSFQLAASRSFFYPTVWPASDADPIGVERILPVALEGEDLERPAPEVVVVPSHFSNLNRIADQLTRQGFELINVGSDEWDPVPSLLPYLRGADIVICSGYSTVMDAAVAGTPCIVHPATDEQHAVANWISQYEVPGFTIAPTPLDVLEAVQSPPDPPKFQNGADVISERVLSDISNDGITHTSKTESSERKLGTIATFVNRTSRLESGRLGVMNAWNRVTADGQRIVDRLIAGITALLWGLSMVLYHGRIIAGEATHRLVAAAAGARDYGAGAWRTVSSHTVLGVKKLKRSVRATAQLCRQYQTAMLAMAFAAGIAMENTLGTKTSRLRLGVRKTSAKLLATGYSCLHRVSRSVLIPITMVVLNVKRLRRTRFRLDDDGGSSE